MEKRYTVRQAAEMVGVKSYVLRYWEDEMELRIGRNELGHRYYTGYDIQLFLNIKELKNRGLQLRAIRELLPKIARMAPGSSESKIKLLNGEIIQENDASESSDAENISSEGQGNPGKTAEDEKILEFQQILERLIAQELRMKNEEEVRCRSLDAAIRRQQMARREAAAASDKKAKKRHKVHN